MTKRQIETKLRNVNLIFDKNIYSLQNMVSPHEFFKMQCKCFTEDIYKLIPSKYSDLFAKVVKRNSVRIICNQKECNNDSYILKGHLPEFGSVISLCKWKGNLDDFGLIHELGHSLDLYTVDGEFANYSVTLKKCEGEQTLYDVLKSELKEKKDIIYKDIISKYKAKLDSLFGEGTFERYVEAMNNIKEGESKMRKCGGLMKCFEGCDENYSKLDEYFSNMASKEDYELARKVQNSEVITYIMSENMIVLDALTCIINTYDIYRLNPHDLKYYKDNKDNIALEFFANLCNAIVLSKSEEIDVVKNYLPRSFEAFKDTYNFIVKNIYEENKAVLR